MTPIVQHITLDCRKTGVQKKVVVRSGELYSREVRISLTDGGQPYEISDDCRAYVRAKKPDGTYLFESTALYTHSVEPSDLIVFTVSSQTAAVAGLVEAQVFLYGADGATLTSPLFIIEVDDTVYADGAIESTNEYTAFQQIISDIAELEGEFDNYQALTNAEITAIVTA